MQFPKFIAANILASTAALCIAGPGLADNISARPVAPGFRGTRPRLEKEQDEAAHSNAASAAGPAGRTNANAAAPTDNSAYMQGLQSKIKWLPPEKCQASKVTVQFIVNANGSVKEVKVPQTSGDVALDQSAISAIEKAAPFAPLADKNHPLRVSFTFNYSNSNSNSNTTSSGVSMKTYNDELWKKIQKTWWVPKRLAFFKVTLKIAINADGSLNEVSMLKSSGDKNADRLAVIGVKRAAPFAPLPEGVQSPYTLTYNLGFENNHDPYFNIWNGERISEGGSYTTAGGVKMTLKDETTAKDRELHSRKEDALIKLADLDDAMARESKLNGPDSAGLVPLLIDYSAAQKVLEDHSAALDRLKQALTICRKHTDPAPLDDTLCALGQADYSLGHTQEAEAELKEAIEIRENTLNRQDKKLKEMLETMGRLLYKQNKSSEADQYYARAKAITIN